MKLIYHDDINIKKQKGSICDHYHGYGAGCTEVEIDVLTGENTVTI